MELASNKMRFLIMAQYRSKLEHVCPDGQPELFLTQLSGLLSRDSHSSADNTYKARSLFLAIIRIPVLPKRIRRQSAL